MIILCVEKGTIDQKQGVILRRSNESIRDHFDQQPGIPENRKTDKVY